MAGHIITVVLLPFIIYISSPGSSLFSYHPTLMSISFLLLLPQAINVFHPRTSWFTRATYRRKVQIHICLQVLSLLLGVVGVRCVYMTKEQYGKPHYTSWHAWCGVACMLYLIAQCVGGAVLNNAGTWVWNWVRRADLRMYHATSGALLHTVSAGVILLGMCTDWYWGEVVPALGLVAWWVGAVSVGLLVLVTLDQVTGKYLHRSAAAPTPTQGGGGRDK